MRRIVRWCAIFSLVALFAAPQPATAAELEWSDQWPKFRIAEGIATGVLYAGSAGIQFGLGSPDEGDWRGPILVDEPLRNAFAADSRRAAEDYALASDIMTGTLIAYPIAADVGLVALGLRRSPSVAIQTGLMAAESFAATSFLVTAGKSIFARQRPPSMNCSLDEAHDSYCSDQRFESFPSGHTTYAFTGASFICAVHENLDMYGGGWADRIPCWAGIGVASASGISRIVSDNHYFSDVAAGATIGFATGYLMPKLLHFGWGRSGGPNTSIRPVPLPQSNGLAITGTF